MTKVDYYEAMSAIARQLTQGGGLFLTAGKKPNPMTIGWGGMGMYWGKPVFVAAVRYSRYTYERMDEGVFTVSVPAAGTMKRALAICGTKSGRDTDKWQAAGLTPVPAQDVDTSVVGDCELYLECRVVMREEMVPGALKGELEDRYYGDKDYHVMFYGEVVGCYRP